MFIELVCSTACNISLKYCCPLMKKSPNSKFSCGKTRQAPLFLYFLFELPAASTYTCISFNKV